MQTSIKKVSNEHEEWKNTLAFYKDEIKIFRHRLDEVTEKHNSQPVLEKMEQFQNQLDIEDEKISELKHEIDAYIHQISIETLALAGHVSHASIEKFDSLKDKMEHTTYLFLGFKFEFKHFVEKLI